jgi:eukaryotic-like serine/threonine-protein kinase
VESPSAGPPSTRVPSEGPPTEALPNGGPPTEALPTAGRVGPPLPKKQPDEVGWVLAGRYQMLERLGAGSMAEVFRAHDQLLGRDVAVKVFRSLIDPGDTLGTPARRQAELRALAHVMHPNLITLFDGDIDGDDPGISGRPGGSAGHAYLVMELIDGPSLASRLTEGPMPDADVRVLGTQLADALAYVHAQGMVHRDVKPANILLGSDASAAGHTMRARLSDFGIVRMVGSERLTSVDFMVGTATYLAPEQARGLEVGPKADIYALGLVLLEALTGQRAYDGTPMETVMARLSRSPDVPADLPGPWPGLLTAMTATDPNARPSAAAVADILRSSASPVAPAGPVPPVVPVPLVPPIGDGHTAILPAVPAGAGAAAAGDEWLEYPPDETAGSRRGLAIAAAILAVAVLLVSGYLLLGNRSDNPSPGAGTSSTTPSTTSRPSSHTTTAARLTTSPPSAVPSATSSAPHSSATRTTAPPTTTAPTSTTPTTSATATATGPSSSTTSAAPLSSQPGAAGGPSTTTSATSATSPTGTAAP